MVCLAHQQETHQAIQKAILGLWDVISGLSSIQPPRSDRYRVTIFGSARIQSGSPIYKGVRRLASELTALGCDIVTGGGPGLMAAANEGSVQADPLDRTQSIGIRIDLETEQETNPFVEKVFQHRTFFSRLHHFVLISDAFVVVPGGIGTTLEVLMIWQLLQVRKLRQMPLILVGDMWADLVDWGTRYMVDAEPPLAAKEDMQIPHCVQTFDEAIALLHTAHQQWQQRK